MDYEPYFQALAQRLGFESLPFDNDGICSLAFEERFTITLEWHAEHATLYLHSTLGTAPEDIIDQLTCFAALLEANLFGRGTGGANLAYEPRSQTLMISRTLVLSQLDADALQQAFGVFVQATETWCERVADRFWEDDTEASGGDVNPADTESANPIFIKV